MRGVLKRREERIANDAYFTPQPLADEICRRLMPLMREQSWVWDPCCGDGAFVDASADAWHEEFLRKGGGCHPNGLQFSGNDLRLGFNFLEKDPVSTPSLILTNPPFLLAEDFAYRALELVREGGHVAFLLRLSFLAGQRRAALYEQHPLRYLIPITPRPSFTPDGKTDASEYGVFVWQRGSIGLPEILPHIRWKRDDRKEDAAPAAPESHSGVFPRTARPKQARLLP